MILRLKDEHVLGVKRMKGYFDRVEDGQLAVILVDEMNKEFIISVNELPEGSKVGTYFDLTIVNGEISSIIPDKETTQIEKEKTDDLMAKLRARSKGSKFKRK